jgi:hypothetical protein
MVLSIIFLEDKHKILLHLSMFYEYQQFFQHYVFLDTAPVSLGALFKKRGMVFFGGENEKQNNVNICFISLTFFPMRYYLFSYVFHL